MKNLKSLIKQQADDLFPKILEYRRTIHQNPELSFAEEKTGIYIKGILDQLGIMNTHGWAGHGVVGIINPEKAEKGVVGIRADIDALPIFEENVVDYKSENEGVMHACGHDAHAASLLGAAHILSNMKEEIDGCIKLIFQPGEEKLPGGASIMIKEGVLENPRPDIVLGQHVHPPLEVGKVGIKGGPYMASADEIFLTVIGKGGHGALPELCIDPILIASHVVTGLQQIISRNAQPAIPSVLTFGKIYSDGGATNVIPDRVFLEGTFRTMNEAWRKKAHSLIHKNIEGIITGMGGTYELDIKVGYPALRNDENVSHFVKKGMIDFLGEDAVVDLPLRMTSEDFSFYSQASKTCFYRLGTGNKLKGITSSVHTPTFNIDENALKVGMGLQAFLAIQYLSDRPEK